MDFVELKLISLSSKLIHVFAAALLGVLTRYVNPEKIEKRLQYFKALIGFVAVPLAMAIDEYFGGIRKWGLCVIAYLLSYYMWLIIETVEKKLPKKLEDKIDKI